MSSFATDDARAIGRKLGARDYITKPFSIRALKERIDHVVAN